MSLKLLREVRANNSNYLIVEVISMGEVFFDELYRGQGKNKHFGNVTREIIIQEPENYILLSKFGRKNIAFRHVAKG